MNGFDEGQFPTRIIIVRHQVTSSHIAAFMPDRIRACIFIECIACQVVAMRMILCASNRIEFRYKPDVDSQQVLRFDRTCTPVHICRIHIDRTFPAGEFDTAARRNGCREEIHRIRIVVGSNALFFQPEFSVQVIFAHFHRESGSRRSGQRLALQTPVGIVDADPSPYRLPAYPAG